VWAEWISNIHPIKVKVGRRWKKKLPWHSVAHICFISSSVRGAEKPLDCASCSSYYRTRGRDMPDTPSSQGALKGHTHTLTQYLGGSFLNPGYSQPSYDGSCWRAITWPTRGKEAKWGRMTLDRRVHSWPCVDSHERCGAALELCVPPRRSHHHVPHCGMRHIFRRRLGLGPCLWDDGSPPLPRTDKLV
jgi:hypothetical protein